RIGSAESRRFDQAKRKEIELRDGNVPQFIFYHIIKMKNAPGGAAVRILEYIRDRRERPILCPENYEGGGGAK
ncbi:MAG: hypothetical protein J6J87_06170, partial [Oscillospiraceae bacterium]|nr:hypothetical protein [Oscillospiraceae bacterium]